MQRLILMRHAKTEAWYEGVDDHARALTGRGHGDAARMAGMLAQQGWEVDLALVSTARRARETWNAMAQLHPGVQVKLLDDLYLASPETLAEALEGHCGDANCLMVIGHNPGIAEFAMDIDRQGGSVDISASGRLRQKYPTGCAALFEAADDAPFIPSLFRLVGVLWPGDGDETSSSPDE